jgi:hypothetical protein
LSNYVACKVLECLRPIERNYRLWQAVWLILLAKPKVASPRIPAKLLCCLPLVPHSIGRSFAPRRPFVGCPAVFAGRAPNTSRQRNINGGSQQTNMRGLDAGHPSSACCSRCLRAGVFHLPRDNLDHRPTHPRPARVWHKAQPAWVLRWAVAEMLPMDHALALLVDKAGRVGGTRGRVVRSQLRRHSLRARESQFHDG